MIYRHTVNIKRAETTNTGGGSISTSTTTLRSDVPCYIQPVSISEAVRAGRTSSAEAYKVYLDSTTDVNSTDLIEFNSTEYNVINKSTWLNTYIKLYIEKLT